QFTLYLMQRRQPQPTLFPYTTLFRSRRMEIDMFRLDGPDFKHVDNRLMALKLVKGGMTKAAMFGPDGNVMQPADELYKKNVLVRSEEHTSELQSRENLVCRLLLEKKK